MNVSALGGEQERIGIPELQGYMKDKYKDC